MVINFTDSNVDKIDSLVKELRINIGDNFTRGNLRDFIVDTLVSCFNENEIKRLICDYTRRNK